MKSFVLKCYEGYSYLLIKETGTVRKSHYPVYGVPRPVTADMWTMGIGLLIHEN